jgi:transketolase
MKFSPSHCLLTLLRRYVLADAPGGTPEVILIASGSEVSLAVETHEQNFRFHPEQVAAAAREQLGRE